MKGMMVLFQIHNNKCIKRASGCGFSAESHFGSLFSSREGAPQSSISAARAYAELDGTLWAPPGLRLDIPHGQVIPRKINGHRLRFPRLQEHVREAFEHARWLTR